MPLDLKIIELQLKGEKLTLRRGGCDSSSQHKMYITDFWINLVLIRSMKAKLKWLEMNTMWKVWMESLVLSHVTLMQVLPELLLETKFLVLWRVQWTVVCPSLTGSHLSRKTPWITWDNSVCDSLLIVPFLCWNCYFYNLVMVNLVQVLGYVLV